MSKEGKAETILIGDSHANHYFRGLSGVLEKPIILAGNASCPPLIGVNIEADQKGCQEKAKSIVSYLHSRDAKDIKTIIISFYFAYLLDTDFAANHIGNKNGPSTISINGEYKSNAKSILFEKGFGNFISELTDLNSQIIIVKDVPEFPFLPTDCVTALFLRDWIKNKIISRNDCDLLRVSVMNRRRPYTEMLTHVSAKFPTVKVIDPLNIICDRVHCSMFKNKSSLYGDSHHLSDFGSDLVGRLIKENMTGN